MFPSSSSSSSNCVSDSLGPIRRRRGADQDATAWHRQTDRQWCQPVCVSKLVSHKSSSSSSRMTKPTLAKRSTSISEMANFLSATILNWQKMSGRRQQKKCMKRAAMKKKSVREMVVMMMMKNVLIRRGREAAAAVVLFGAELSPTS